MGSAMRLLLLSAVLSSSVEATRERAVASPAVLSSSEAALASLRDFRLSSAVAAASAAFA